MELIAKAALNGGIVWLAARGDAVARIPISRVIPIADRDTVEVPQPIVEAIHAAINIGALPAVAAFNATIQPDPLVEPGTETRLVTIPKKYRATLLLKLAFTQTEGVRSSIPHSLFAGLVIGTLALVIDVSHLVYQNKYTRANQEVIVKRAAAAGILGALASQAAVRSAGWATMGSVLIAGLLFPLK